MMNRFCGYIEKVFGLGEWIARLSDSRAGAQIPTSAVWTSGFLMSAMRLGSLNAMESELRIPKRLDGLVGQRKPSADTVGRVYSLIDPAGQREMLGHLVHRLGRNKALRKRWGLRFAAVDGHEFFSQSTSPL
jgi:hypothetical protein